MDRTVCAAIAGRRVVRFAYDGGERVVEPHAHWLTIEGIEVVSGYQVDGHSTSEQVEGWKTFHVARMDGFAETGVVFLRPRADYNPEDARIKQLCCRV